MEINFGKGRENVIHNHTSSGMNLFGTLFIVFLILKLAGVIDWSWWFITMPLWIGVVIVLGLVFVAFGGICVWIFIKWLIGRLKK